MDGLIQLTFVYENGESDTAYFDPAKLDAAMRSIGQIKDSRGQTNQDWARSTEGWVKLREKAIAGLRGEEFEGAMLLLMWLYLNAPSVGMHVAAQLQELLDQEGMACLTVLQQHGLIAATVTPQFDPEVSSILAKKLPPGVTMAWIGADDVGGSA